MTTSPDAVTYPQSVSELVGPTEAAPWDSSLRPTNPWVGLFGFAEDLIDFEFWDGIEWLHPIWAERDAHFLGDVTIDGSLTTHGFVLFDGTHLSTATTGSNTLSILRPGLTGAASANNFWAFRSAISLTDTTHPAGVHFNSFISTNVLANAEPGEVWSLMSRIYTGSSSLSSNAVAFYAQAERDPVLPSGIGVPLLGAVIETRSGSGAGAATDGIIQGLEIDIAANGAVTPTAYRQFMVLLGKRGVSGGSNMEVSNLISVVSADGNPWSFEKGLRIAGNVTYKEAIIDTRLGTEGTGAAIIWPATGQHIFLNTAGTAQLSGNTAGAVISSKSFITGLDADTDATSALNAAASTNRLQLYTAAGTRVWSNGATTADAWVVGRYVAGVFQESSLSIANATGNATFAKNLIIGTANSLTVTPGAASGTAGTIVGGGTGGFSFTGTVPWSFNRVDLGRSQTISQSGSTLDVTKVPIYSQAAMTGTNSGAVNLSTNAYLVGVGANVAAPSALVSTMTAILNTGGAAAASGGWHAAQFITTDTAGATNDQAGGGAAAWLGIQVSRLASVNQGGSGTTAATSFGQSWGMDVISATAAGATNLKVVCGVEVDMNQAAGSSMMSRWGLAIAGNSNAKGAQFDSAFLVGQNSLSTVGWREGLTFGSTITQWPFRSDSTLIAAKHGQTYLVTPTAADTGLDLRDPTFTTAAIKLPGAEFSPTGALRIGTTYFEQISTGLSIDARASIGTGAPTINAAGSGYTSSSIGDDAHGGSYTLGVTAGVVTSVSVLQYPVYPTTSPPATLAITARPPFGGTGTVLNVSWTTTAVGISIAPTAGGKIGFNGTAPIVKPTVTGSRLANAALASLLTGLASYGLLTDSTTV